jgi:hypothetical protein
MVWVRINRRRFLTGLGAGALAAGATAMAGPLRVAQAATQRLSGNVTLGTTTVVAGDLLEFDPNVSTTVEISGDLMVEGTLRMKPASGSIQHVLRFTNGGELQVMTGQLDIVGTPKTAWNRSGNDSTWGASDALVVTPVAAGDYTVKPFTKGSGVPKFTSSAGTFSAEVLNLTRNVRIEGTPTVPMKRIMIISPKPQTIRYAAVRYAGITTELAMYPIHMHLMGEGARGSLLEGVVVQDGYHHAYAIHGSHGVTLRDCIAYSIVGDAYWWDLPPSQDDAVNNTNDGVWENCVAADVRPGASTAPAELSGFLLGAGSGNVIRSCVAAAVVGGVNTSGFHWPSHANHQPNVWVFEDCVGHNIKTHGIFIWQNTDTLGHFIDRFVGYNNLQAGSNHGAYNHYGYHYRDTVFIGNGETSFKQHAQGCNTPSQTPPQERLSFERVTFTGDPALMLVLHQLEATKATLYLDCQFDGPIEVTDGANKRGYYDFVRCGLEESDFRITSIQPQSVIRVQRPDNTAFQITASGTTTIAAFWDGWSTSASGLPVPGQEFPNWEPACGNI